MNDALSKDVQRAIAALALRGDGVLSPQTALEVLASVRRHQIDPVTALLQRVNEIDVRAAVADELDVAFVDLGSPDNGWSVDQERMRDLDLETLRKASALILTSSSGQHMVAMTDPFIHDDLRAYLNEELGDYVRGLGVPSQIQAALSLLTTADTSILDELDMLTPVPAPRDREPVKAAERRSPIIEWVDQLFARAAVEGASDVHMMFQRDGSLLVRFRLDGVLVTQPVPKQLRHREHEIVGSLLNKCPTINPSDRTRPQDGTFSFTTPRGKRIDTRLGMLPQVNGPTIVTRLLDPDNVRRRLEDMGFARQTLATMRDAVNQSQGMVLMVGPTGSGKAVTLSTRIPTPTGYTTMGALRVGDEVLGSDGRPCRVTGLSEVIDAPELYRVRFSDGQEVLADRDHQWLVSTHHGRNVPRTTKRTTALRRHQAAHAAAAELQALADSWNAAPLLTAAELHAVLVDHDLAAEFSSPAVISAALAVVECPSRPGHRTRPVKVEVARRQATVYYPAQEVLGAVAATRSRFAQTAEAVLETGEFPVVATLGELDALLGAGTARPARHAARRHGICGEYGTYDHHYTSVQDRTVPVTVYPATVALRALAVRLRERFHTAPADTASMSRMTTAEMLSAGLKLRSGHTDFAVPLTAPLDLPDADLPIDPYLLGSWLGDGSARSGRITVGRADADFTTSELAAIWPTLTSASIEKDDTDLLSFGRPDPGRCVRGHRDWRTTPTQRYCAQCRTTGAGDPVVNQSLGAHLAAMGIVEDKRIPSNYLRGSDAQRLALLQGLMDTDGTISATGACELTFSDRQLAADALDLIRSLGIKASVRWDASASYRDESGNPVVCKNRHRIGFTTTREVFRMPRKACRIPVETRQTQNWLYITDITPVRSGEPGYEAARCISVDSADHTYLCADGYVVTSNTTTLYGLLNELDSSTLQILTAEDPVEYRMEKIGQTQIRSDLGEKSLTFAQALRAMMRLDPNVILVGEIRDRETAEVAMHAALTGHLLLSTLHTNSALGVITRMGELGTDPFAIAESLSLSASQRLVRHLHSCAITEAPTEAEVHFMRRHGFEVPDRVRHPAPRGCPGCRQTGFAGRLPVVEAFAPTTEIRTMIATEQPLPEIKRVAAENGYVSIVQDGLRHVAAGGTTIAELVRCLDAGGE